MYDSQAKLALKQQASRNKHLHLPDKLAACSRPVGMTKKGRRQVCTEHKEWETCKHIHSNWLNHHTHAHTK